ERRFLHGAGAAGAVDHGAGGGADPDSGADRGRADRHGAGRDLDQRTDVELHSQDHRGVRHAGLVRRVDHGAGRGLHSRNIRADTGPAAMMAPGFAGVETQLWIWLIAMIRPGAAFIAAPVFGAPAVPLQLRLILSLALGLAALNAVPIHLPQGGVESVEGVMLVAGEVLAGLAMGFAVQIGYAA